MGRCGDMKNVVHGSVKEVPWRLFAITRDNDEIDGLYDRVPDDQLAAALVGIRHYNETGNELQYIQPVQHLQERDEEYRPAGNQQ